MSSMTFLVLMNGILFPGAASGNAVQKTADALRTAYMNYHAIAGQPAAFFGITTHKPLLFMPMAWNFMMIVRRWQRQFSIKSWLRCCIYEIFI